MIQVVCAWCQKLMGEKPGDGGVSHGICEGCFAKVSLEVAEERQEWLENQKGVEDVGNHPPSR
jgi:hypothetical protein